MPPRTKDVKVDKFSGGMDCRMGVIGDSLDSFREMESTFVSEDNDIQLRAPCVTMGGLISSLAQGMIENNGKFYCLARRGDQVVNTGHVAGFLNILYFDTPENCGNAWTLVAFDIFEKVAVAYVRHTFPGLTITSRIYLHVFDLLANNPTYYADPSGPWDWGPSGYPTNAYGIGAGVATSWMDYTPIIQIAVEKLFSSRVDQNTAFSGIARARIWNARSAADIEKTGAMYYFTVPNASTAQFAIPEAFSDFADYHKFAGYVLERSNADGSWTKIVETQGAPGAGQWQMVTGTRSWSTVAVAVINSVGLTPDALIRIRILMTPEVVLSTGGVVTPGPEVYRGDGATINWPSVTPYVAFANDQVSVNGNVKAITTYYDVVNVNGLAQVNFKRYAQTTDGRLSVGAITPGTGYTSFPGVALSGGSGGTGAAISVTSLQAVLATIGAGGAGYAVNDILTVVGDTGTAATFRVTGTGGGGSVTSVAVVGNGLLTVVAGNPHATTGGTGTGCTLNVSYGIAGLSVTPGYGYVTAPTAVITGGAGTGAVINVLLVLPVGNTAIDYGAATDGDFGRLSVFFNGVRQTEGTGYTLVNSGGQTLVLPAAPLAIGTTLNAQLIVPVDILILFASPTVAVSAATIIYEQNQQTASSTLVSSLGPSASYYLAVAANGVTSFKITTASWTGLERYQILIVSLVTTDAGGNIISSTPFQYGPQALTQWYNNRHQQNLDYWSGENEASFLNTSTHDKSGSNITTMVAIKNRMLICYAETSQLWQVDPLPTNCAFLDQYDFGTRYLGLKFYNQAMIYTQKGFRTFDLQGISFQALVDINMGEKLKALGDFTVLAATFWPWRGSYVAFCRLDNCAKYARLAGLPADSVFNGNGIYGFVVLSFSKESQINGWSWWPVAGLTNVTKMLAQDERIYCLQGNEVWYFNDKASVYRDGAQDANGNGTVAYRGVANWHLVELAGKGSARLLHMDMVKSGSVSIRVSTMAWNAAAESVGPLIADTTVGRLRVPLRSTGRAIGVRMLTTDPFGMVVKAIRYEFMPLAR